MQIYGLVGRGTGLLEQEGMYAYVYFKRINCGHVFSNIDVVFPPMELNKKMFPAEH